MRTDGVALEALDWAMQEGIIGVEQRNAVVREMARRTGNLQRRVSSSASFNSLSTIISALAPEP